jgi:regulator of cell morphogenesis and NO signaling
MEISPRTLVAEITSRYPECAAVFEHYRIDRYDLERRSLAEVCADRHLSVAEVQAALHEAVRRAPPKRAGGETASLKELIGHIEATCEAGLRSRLPRIAAVLETTLAAQRPRNPALDHVAREFQELRNVLQDHAAEAERILFPLLRMLERAQGSRRLPVATLAGPIQVMKAEHARIESQLACLRRHTQDYALPEQACPGLRGLYDELLGLEADLAEHIRLEGEELFPRVLAIDRARR